MLMEVLPTSQPADLAAVVQSFEAILLLDPAGKDSLPAALNGIARGSRVMALVGPEGGFTNDDLRPVSAADGGRLRRVRLGDGILRIETAAMAVAAAVLAAGG
jgi:16S rRNA U1498 N3-methylase RsmE